LHIDCSIAALVQLFDSVGRRAVMRRARTSQPTGHQSRDLSCGVRRLTGQPAIGHYRERVGCKWSARCQRTERAHVSARSTASARGSPLAARGV